MQNCLSELVQGCPKQLKHKDLPATQIWDELLRYCKLGYPLGAGSPSHPDGDSHINEEGIAQGHAYSILKAVEADGNKLICMRNPWKHTEWKGDWSDNSEKWNQRIQNLVGYLGASEDGIFWMDFNDYLNQYECAYVCIMLSKEQGWKSLDVKDKWIGKYSEGLPRKEKTSAKLENSPQYSLKITKPGKAYLIYRLNDKLDTNRSMLYGFLSVQANNGKLIDSNDKKKTIGSVGPKNSIQQDLELDFPANLTYPITYTILASFQPNKDKEVQEPSFSIKVFTQDKEAILTKIN